MASCSRQTGIYTLFPPIDFVCVCYCQSRWLSRGNRCVVYSLLSNDRTIEKVFLSTASGDAPSGGRKTSSRTALQCQIIFTGLLGSLNSTKNCFENKVLLKPVQGGLGRYCTFNNRSLNRVSSFVLFDVFLTIQNVHVFICIYILS